MERELIEELLNEVILYLEGYYPWGILTKPLTPTLAMALSVAYTVVALILALSLVQLIASVRYGLASLATTGNTLPRPRGELPRVSIIVPIKEEPREVVLEALANLAKLDYPRDLLEVIFVSDDSGAVAKELGKEVALFGEGLGLKVKFLVREVPMGYKGGALNHGLRLSSGDVVVAMDVDTRLGANYLREAVYMLLSGYHVVTAPWKGYVRVEGSFAKLVKFLYDIYGSMFIRGRYLAGGFRLVNGNNFAAWRWVLEGLGGLCHCVGEDLDLSIRLMLGGYRVGLMNSFVYCEVPSTYNALKAQFGRWLFNGVWGLRRYMGQLSKVPGLWGKVDFVLWMIQFPTLSLAALSVTVSAILMLMGVLLPPLPIMAMNIALWIATIAHVGTAVAIGLRLGYGPMDVVANIAKSAVLALVLSFPLLIYTAAALWGREWRWRPTPKGPRALAKVSDLSHEKAALAILSTLLLASVATQQPFAMFYILALIFLMTYGLGMIGRAHEDPRTY